MVWNETFWTNLKTKTTTFLDSILGGDDIDAVVTKLTSETTKMQVALYAKDRERKQQALRDAFSAANAETGADGFTFPNHMTTVLQMGAQSTYMFDLSQVSRELITAIFDWAKSNYQFTMQKQIDAHAADVEFNMRYASALTEVYREKTRFELEKVKSNTERILAQIEAEVKSLGARIEAAKANASLTETDFKGLELELESAKAGAGYTVSKDQQIIASYIAQADQNFKAFTQSVTQQLELAKTRINGARDAVTATSALAASASAGVLSIAGA
jgi:hypothetical protein